MNIQNMNLLVSTFKKYGHFSAEIESEIDTKTKSIFKKKGSYLIKEGQVIHNLYIIDKGLIRSFYKKEGQEITIWFGYENAIFIPIASFYDNKVSYETIQCLEDTQLQYISGKDLSKLYAKYSVINTIGRKLTEDYCVILDDRIFSFQTQSAKERYNSLIKSHPEIIKRVSLGHIASYLGITQETLSRIRHK